MQITNDRYWFSEILKRKTEVILDPYLPPFNYLNGSVKNATLFNTIMTDVADLDKKIAGFMMKMGRTSTMTVIIQDISNFTSGTVSTDTQ